MNKEDILEFFLLVVVVGSVILIPFAIKAVDKYLIASQFPEDAQVITLYGIAKEGIWTREPVNSFNYWWKKFKRAEEISIRDDGTPIFFRVTSTDVMHSFAIPLYRIGPYDIEPGKWKTVELKTDKPLRSTRFMCYQYCDEDHENMKGQLVVVTRDEE